MPGRLGNMPRTILSETSSTPPPSFLKDKQSKNYFPKETRAISTLALLSTFLASFFLLTIGINIIGRGSDLSIEVLVAGVVNAVVCLLMFCYVVFPNLAVHLLGSITLAISTGCFILTGFAYTYVGMDMSIMPDEIFGYPSNVVYISSINMWVFSVLVQSVLHTFLFTWKLFNPHSQATDEEQLELRKTGEKLPVRSDLQKVPSSSQEEDGQYGATNRTRESGNWGKHWIDCAPLKDGEKQFQKSINRQSQTSSQISYRTPSISETGDLNSEYPNSRHSVWSWNTDSLYAPPKSQTGCLDIRGGDAHTVSIASGIVWINSFKERRDPDSCQSTISNRTLNLGDMGSVPSFISSRSSIGSPLDVVCDSSTTAADGCEPDTASRCESVNPEDQLEPSASSIISHVPRHLPTCDLLDDESMRVCTSNRTSCATFYPGPGQLVMHPETTYEMLTRPLRNSAIKAHDEKFPDDPKPMALYRNVHPGLVGHPVFVDLVPPQFADKIQKAKPRCRPPRAVPDVDYVLNPKFCFRPKPTTTSESKTEAETQPGPKDEL